MGKAGEVVAGGSKAGENPPTILRPSPTTFDAKAGQNKAGETPAGGSTTTAYADLTLSHPTASITLREAITLTAPAQTLALEHPAATITGAGQATTTAPTQTLSLDHPTATLRQVNTLTAPAQTLSLDHPTATITGDGAVTLSGPVQTLQLDALPGKIGFGDWVVDGQALRVQAVTATPEGIDLDVVARTGAERSTLQTLRDNAGETQVREKADGTLDVADTVAGGNTYEVIPQVSDIPPRTTRTMHAEDVSIGRLSASQDAVRASISLSADTRSRVAYQDATDSSKWTFAFDPGTRLVTNRVHDISEGEGITLRAIFESEQSEGFETTAAAVAGAVVESVPDGEELARDTTPNSRQTVTVTSPDSVSNPPVPDGDYVVTDWEVSGTATEGYTARFDLEDL